MDMDHAILGRRVSIAPPLLNSASPWASTYGDLKGLYFCPCTGAVTTRTCLVAGFDHDDQIHQYTFVDPVTQRAQSADDARGQRACGSLNTLAYSPRALDEYLDTVVRIGREWEAEDVDGEDTHCKPVIVSVTGNAQEVRRCWETISERQGETRIPLLMEINLSCPNIGGRPPPAYSPPSLRDYLARLTGTGVPIGLKLPPYTYHDQFRGLVDTLRAVSDTCRISFITAVNTLGSSLVLQDRQDASSPGYVPAIASSTGAGIGGLAGAPLHPLALGNVSMLSGLIQADPRISHVRIIGVGGVSDSAGFERMKLVGASAVAIGTALGARGPDVFCEIVAGLEKGL